MGLFILKEILDILSYKSALGQSLKQISLRETPLQSFMEGIAKYRSSYVDVLVQENLICSIFKSDDSIMRKYKKQSGRIADLSNVLMTYSDFVYGSMDIQKTIRNISE